MNIRFAATVATLAVGTLAHAQSPRAPRETVIAPLDKGKVTVEYGRPALKGRTITQLMGELPAHRVWFSCTGGRSRPWGRS